MIELLSARELSEKLRISNRMIWKLLSAKKIPPPVRIGRSVRWRADDVAQWISNGCPPTQTAPQEGRAR